MNVLYDHAILARQPYGGFSRYYAKLIPMVAAMPDVRAHVFMGLHINEYGLERHRGQFASFFGVRRPSRGKTYRLTAGLNAWLFRRFARRADADVYHATTFSDFFPGFRGKRVITVHDMTVERFPELAAGVDPILAPKRQAVERADGIVCISEHTRNDLVELFGLPKAKIAVIPHANALTASGDGPSPLPRPYILFVGGRGSYKNFRTLADAYAGSAELQRAADLLCFGGGPLTADERARYGLASVAGKVHWMSGEDDLLARAYANASAFVYPSLYEGFGMPLLEAMHYRCPVLAADASCFPEIGGDATLYFSPESSNDLAEKLGRLIADEPLRKELVAKGIERERLYSWDRVAEQTTQFYRELHRE